MTDFFAYPEYPGPTLLRFCDNECGAVVRRAEQNSLGFEGYSGVFRPRDLQEYAEQRKPLDRPLGHKHKPRESG